jgi:hypothetical protein
MKHTILYVAANPRGTDRLALDRECEALQHELRLTADRDYFEFHSRWAVGVDHLMRALNEMSPAILHFSGHCSVASTANSHGGTHRDVQSPCGAGILLEGLDGAQHVGHRALAAMIASVPPVPRLVVLNACHSADVADSLREVVDCVVGVDGAIEDAAARAFTVGFYRALGYRRHSIGTAVKQARATMDAKQLSGQLVTCHPRNGMNADDIYLVASSRARDLGDGPVRERSQRESPSGNERASEPLEHEARDLTLTTTFGATAQPMDSGAWPASAAAPAPAAGIPLPRCLGDIEPIVAPAAGDLAGVAAQLRELLAALPRVAAPWSTEPLDRRASGDHVRLYDRLGQLTDAVFEQIVARAKIDRSSFAPRTAALAQRALDIAQLAALDPTLCQRVSIELDRHAPWTLR